jgi:hypothetical protein
MCERGIYEWWSGNIDNGEAFVGHVDSFSVDVYETGSR